MTTYLLGWGHYFEKLDPNVSFFFLLFFSFLLFFRGEFKAR